MLAVRARGTTIAGGGVAINRKKGSTGGDLLLAIDVGTGSVRAALCDTEGGILAFAAREHDQIVPRYGWSEQRPAAWWEGVAASVREVLTRIGEAPARIRALAVCGQQLGTVLIDEGGEPVLDRVPLWNDKRAAAQVRAFAQTHDPEEAIGVTANPPAANWSAFKLAWLSENRPQEWARAATLLMPKDYINFRLTGERAIDPAGASLTFLLDADSLAWSDRVVAWLGLRRDMLPPLVDPTAVLGAVTEAAARETGLRAGTPVVCGTGDFPATLLGSGVCRPGMGSDTTGTSTILTALAETPIRHPEISNLRTAEGHWGACIFLDSGGDAMRWARRAFHEGAYDYARIAALAESAPPGAGGLFFLPFLSGERLGASTNARAQFFGLNLGHETRHLHRAILEGVGLAALRHLRIIEAAGGRLERIVASGGGAKSELWMRIKASVFGVPYMVPENPECGVVGSAILAGTGIGLYGSVEDGVARLVRYAGEIAPDPEWAAVYRRMIPIFEKLYACSRPYSDLLERLEAELGGALRGE
jgi:xylulokinase